MEQEIPDGERMARKLGGAPSYQGVPVVIRAREVNGALVDESGKALEWPKGALVEIRLWHEKQREWQADKQVDRHIPFLPQGTVLAYGVKARNVLAFHEAFLNWDGTFRPLCTMDEFEPLRERWRKPDEYLWLPIVLLQNSWLTLRGDRLAKLTPVRVRVLGLDFEAKSINEAVTEIIKRTQPDRSSPVCNVFRHLVAMRMPLKLLDLERVDTVQVYLAGELQGFDDEQEYSERGRMRDWSR